MADFVRDIGGIRRLIRERGIDLVLLSGLVNPHAAIAARLEGRAVVWQILDTRSPMALRRVMMPLVARLADAVMNCGVEVARVHPGTARLADRMVLYYPPVDTAGFNPDPARRAAAREELRVPADAPLIGTVGNLNPMKGHEYLLRAAAILRRDHPKLHVRVMGAHTPTHAAYAARLRAEAQSLGLFQDGALEFVDPGDRVAELLPALDVFMQTSVPRSEGMPTVILEAMACGVPVAATAIASVQEVVEDGANGLIMPPLDPPAMAAAARRLLDDPALRARVSDEGRRRAVERYGVEQCAGSYLAAFALARAHRAARGSGPLRRPAAHESR
ncbi:MAG: glycosyltransferase [Dehalococcoidia bacterium]